MRVARNLSELSDNELISLLKQEDQQAFVALYDRYWAELYACAFHLFPHRETCEDLIHDVFLYLWNSREKLEIRSLRDYLYIAIKHKALNKIRSQKKQIEISGEDAVTLTAKEETDDQLMVKELNLLFEQGMHSLPEKCREILTLSRKEHLSNKEIASRLNLSPKTVENQINIGLKKIRLMMSDFLLFYFIYFFFG
ncbi:RNA polymerase sigma-70 factor [Pedobacter sp. GR22-6]|uniref:RNA polymerase sigma-70 factor n=1 Tax=Pedobacter sp. GR22-6 TaxID=3127957 RepID=UPI00307EC170